MNRDIIVFDFETGGRNPLTCQPTQVAALALDGRNFKLKGMVSETFSRMGAMRLSLKGTHYQPMTSMGASRGISMVPWSMSMRI